MSAMLVNQSVAHPWECDVQGHLTTRFYVSRFDDASYHFLTRAFGANAPGLGWADVRHEIDYHSEVAAGDLLEVHGTLMRMGGKSVQVRYSMRRLADQATVAVQLSTSVLFDLEARKAVALTETMRSSASPWLHDGDD